MLRPLPAKDRISKRHALPKNIQDGAAFDQTVHSAALDAFTPNAPFLDRQSKIVTIGSCFAGNVARVLTEAKYSVVGLQVRERLFNAFALRDFLKQVAANGDVTEFAQRWELPEEQITDLRQALGQTGTTIIITLGLSFVWFDTQTDEMVFDPAQKVGLSVIVEHPERFEMRPTSVSDNVEALCETINVLRSMNPWAKIILTLSPLPLVRSVCDYPVAVADAISKATLRCALHEVTLLKIKDIFYFPSYEILRGLATLVDVIWNDGYTISHIRKEWTDYTLSKFMAAYCVGERAVSPPFPAK